MVNFFFLSKAMFIGNVSIAYSWLYIIIFHWRKFINFITYYKSITIICLSAFRATIMKILTMCHGPEKIWISKIIFPALLILHSLQLPNNTHACIVNITHCTLFWCRTLQSYEGLVCTDVNHRIMEKPEESLKRCGMIICVHWTQQCMILHSIYNIFTRIWSKNIRILKPLNIRTQNPCIYLI